MNTRMRPYLVAAGIAAIVAGPSAIAGGRFANAAVTSLSAEEGAALRFAREEEKLARDLYRAFAAKYRSRVFSNIAVAEQKHMDAMLTLLDRYGVADPVGTNPDGVFTDPGLQTAYDEILARGQASVAASLLAGAYVEELDLHDLERSPLYASPHADIARTLGNLHAGSEKHLGAFSRTWERTTGGVYAAQLLDADIVDRILGR